MNPLEAKQELQNFINITQPHIKVLLETLLVSFRIGPVECIDFVEVMLREQFKSGVSKTTTNLTNGVIMHQLLLRVANLEKVITDQQKLINELQANKQ